MACHTWTYKKCSALTEEEKSKITKLEIKNISSWWGFKKTYEEIVETVKEWKNIYDFDIYKGKTPEKYASDLISEFVQKRDDIKRQGFQYIIQHKEEYGAKFKTIDGEDYFLIGCDTPLRVYKYSEEKFTDCETLLDWVRTLNPKSYGYYTIKGDWKEGWTTNLPIIVRDYFFKHGKENLYIEFG